MNLRTHTTETIQPASVDSLLAELEATRLELATVKRNGGTFSGIITHDLQAPLRAITGFLDLLMRKYSAQLDETARQYIGFAVNGAEKMKRLINDLHLYTSIGYSSESVVTTDLTQLLQEAWKEWNQPGDQNGIRLSCEPLPVLEVRPGQFLLMFRELTSNAMKFNAQAIKELHVTATRDEHGSTIHFTDNGIGMNPDFSEKIFQLFRRLHADENTYKGLGTGLAVCHRIAELHGGWMGVDAVPGKGSRFWIHIPANNVKSNI